TIDTTVSPRDYYAFNVSNGLFTDPKYPGGYDSPYHGDYPLNTNFEIDPMGKYLFNGSGVIFTTAQDKTQDMRYAGKISQAFNGIAFEPDLSYFYTTPVTSKAVNVYRSVDFTATKSLELADQGTLLFKQGNKLVTLVNPAAPTGSYVTGVQVLDVPPLAPIVMSADPADNSTEQPLSKPLTFTFNKNITPGTAYDSITLAKTNVAGSSVPVTKSVSGNVLTIKPLASLDLNTGYTVTLPAGAVQDADAVPSDIYSLRFQTTADSTSPTVASTDPTDGAVNQPANKSITVTFSENILSGAGYDQITLAETGNPANQAAVTKSISGKVLTITPVGNLAYSTGYTLTIPGTAVTDSVGNPLGSDYALSFSTAQPPDLTAPTIVSTDPANGAVDVPVTTPITISFSEAIQLGSNSSAITVKKGTKTVGYKLSISGSNLVITPNLSLSTRSTYTVSIPAGAVTDLSGNSLAAAYTFSFSTVR
ncbi:MAG TPA: Ig-like domain-containing protein, partial [Verrucomicrobiae bacterium]|nr:Ig-like domain-containing protein [Verrucomicrobiae bacterium]